MRIGCKSVAEVFQDIPRSGKLRVSMNKTRNELLELLAGQEGVAYSYVLTTLNLEMDTILQGGSAPNFQGGLITLCTCKYRMRTYKDTNDWKDVWVAGFTSKNIKGDGKNYLFYLMRIEKAYPSQKDLWDTLSPRVRDAKNARLNRLGDLYEPRYTLRDRFSHSNYHPPIRNHVHEKDGEWQRDVEYHLGGSNKRPALLVGDSNLSFLWCEPTTYLQKRVPRIKRWDNVQDILKLLGNKR